MVVTLIGSNFTGKTVLIEQMLGVTGGVFLDIRKYRDYIDRQYFERHRTGIGPWRQQLEVLRGYPRSLGAIGAMLRCSGTRMAMRYWRYFFIHVMMLRAAGAGGELDELIFLDEGVIKKLYEAVPFIYADAYARERHRWVRFAKATSAALAVSLRGLVDLVVYTYSTPEVLVARARARDDSYVQEVGETRLVNRYRLQHEVYGHVLGEMRRCGVQVHEIDTTDIAVATDKLRRIVTRAGWSTIASSLHGAAT